MPVCRVARDDLARLVALRSVANPAIEPASECRAAAALVAELFAEVGVDGVRAVETPDGSLAVVGRSAGPDWGAAGRCSTPTTTSCRSVDPRPGRRLRGS